MKDIQFAAILITLLSLMTYGVTGVWQIALAFATVFAISLVAYEITVETLTKGK